MELPQTLELCGKPHKLTLPGESWSLRQIETATAIQAQMLIDGSASAMNAGLNAKMVALFYIPEDAKMFTASDFEARVKEMEDAVISDELLEELQARFFGYAARWTSGIQRYLNDLLKTMSANLNAKGA